MNRVGLFAIVAAATALSASSADAQVRTWTSEPDFKTGTLRQTSATNPPGAIVLGPTPVSQTNVVWSTNFRYGYTVRLDTRTGKQTGRYDSVLTAINGTPTGARPAQEYCNFSSQGNCPGRVAVDALGDVWIVNRAFGQQGTVTKFSGDLSHCIDRNGNGVIDTSADKNGDGLISVLDPTEYFGQNDECILTTFAVGPVNVFPRGVAIDKNGKVWISTFNDGKLYRYNPNEPVSLEATVTVGGNPYSLATGGDYVFVSSSSPTGTKRVNITTLAQNTAPCPGTYGVVADPGGDVAWLGGYFTGNGLYKADFTAGTCTFIGTGSTVTAMTLDLAGNIWAAGYGNNTVSKLNSAGVILGTYSAGGANPHGLSVDFQGNIWIVNHVPPVMVKMNPTTGAIIGSYTLGGPGVLDADPYLYSDYTGTQIDRQAPYSRLGTWSATYDGGASNIPWSNLAWNSETGGSTPSLTSMKLSVRASNTLSGLTSSTQVPATNGAALAGVVGRYVQVEADLTGPGYVTPVLSDVTVTGPCGSTPTTSCCVTDADCNDSNVCTADTCPVPGGACSNAKVSGCCLAPTDCDDKDLCTDDSCPTSGTTCSFARRTGCCTSNADCADTDPCTVDVCSGPGGTCSHPLIAGCCKTTADCTAASVCTTSTCPSAGSLCVTTPKVGCCKSDKDCTDSDLCTADKCDLSTGICSSTKVVGCCNADGECNDGKPCTKDSCSGPGGVCVTTAISACCLTDGDCNDGNACTADSCSGAGGTCAHKATESCCAVAGDCDDGNACTDDLCPTPGGACAHKKKDGCCLAAADCDDGNKCTRDTCTAAGKTCAHTAVIGCCNATADCPVGECVSSVCTPVADAGPDTAPTAEVGTGGGCGCRVQDRSTPNGLFAALAALAIAARRRSDRRS